MTNFRLQALAVCLALTGCPVVTGCRHAPLRPLPDPLPEALAWTVSASEGAFLGLKTEENDSGSLDSLEFDPGARVIRVVENSPAQSASFRQGDVVLAFEDTPVEDPEALEALVAASSPGDEVRLTVRRGDSVNEVRVVLAGRGGDHAASAELAYHVDRSRSRAGWVTDGPRARLVTAARDGPIDKARIPIGSCVTAIDGRPVHSARELIRQFEARDPGTRVKLAYEKPDGGTDSAKVRLLDTQKKLTSAWFPILFRYKADADGENVTTKVLDFFLFSLFKYERTGEETYTRILIFSWRSGVGELSS